MLCQSEGGKHKCDSLTLSWTLLTGGRTGAGWLESIREEEGFRDVRKCKSQKRGWNGGGYSRKNERKVKDGTE